MKHDPVIANQNGLSRTDYLSIESDINGVDFVAHEMERKWGMGRLRLVVNPDLRQRFDQQRVFFNDAVWSGNVADVRKHGEATIRGWQALDAAATADGQQPLAPTIWETTTPDGEVVRIVQTEAEASAVQADGRKVQVWTLAEIGKVIGDFADSAGLVKSFFDGATVESVKTTVRPIASDDAMDSLDQILGVSL
jgi:hypothetical protein